MAPNRVEVGPSGAATSELGAGQAAGIQRVDVDVGQNGHQVAADRHSGEHAGRSWQGDTGGDHVGAHRRTQGRCGGVDAGGDATDSHHHRAGLVDLARLRLHGGGTGEKCEVAVAGRIDEGLCGELDPAAAVVEQEQTFYLTLLAPRVDHLGVQQETGATVGDDPVDGELDRLGIDGEKLVAAEREIRSAHPPSLSRWASTRSATPATTCSHGSPWV